jgi:hypothetical protein
MKLTVSLMTISVVATGLLAAAASADPPRPAGINHRQERQWQGIRRGIRNEELTGREAGRLFREQREIAVDERRAKCDGRFTVRERAQIHRELNQQRHRIFRLKHNDRER